MTFYTSFWYHMDTLDLFYFIFLAMADDVILKKLRNCSIDAKTPHDARYVSV